MLIAITTKLSKIDTKRFTKPLAKSPMMATDEENAIVGIVANGSWRALKINSRGIKTVIAGNKLK